MKYLRLKTTTGYIDRLDIVPPVEGSDCESVATESLHYKGRAYHPFSIKIILGRGLNTLNSNRQI